MLRIDESLYFPDARCLEDCVLDAVAAHPALRHVVLVCSAVNAIDASALESLETLDARQREAGVALRLAEVKGPVMDRPARMDFCAHRSGDVHLTACDAFRSLAPATMTAPRRITAPGARPRAPGDAA